MNCSGFYCHASQAPGVKGLTAKNLKLNTDIKYLRKQMTGKNEESSSLENFVKRGGPPEGMLIDDGIPLCKKEVN